MLVVPFCFVLSGLLASLIPEAQGHCRNLRFTSAPIHGYRINNHVIRTINVINEDICQLQCYLEPNCVSYNFNKKEEATGKHKCELNNATYEHDNEHSGDLKKKESYVYRGAENACVKKPCQNDATCQAGFTDRDYQCLCTPGFIGHDCEVDVNECAKETSSCDVNAKCKKILGSFKCTCKDGFRGDGINCTDIDECANGTHSCDVNALCNNTRGSYKCTCKDGFYGDGINCTEIDECASRMHNCDVNAVCNNTRGSHNCTCKDGFHGYGINCTDIDECANGTHSCDVNAVCNNTLGSYNCTCNDGFYGDGINCAGFTATFTSLEKSGKEGPTSLGTHYTRQDHDGQVKLSSGTQQWSVPYTGQYRIEAVGAAGGHDKNQKSAQYRGRGARMVGTFNLSQGEMIQILVGQEGEIRSIKYLRGSGGGGGTFVVRGSNTSLIVAGGGGGVRAVTSRHEECDANISASGSPGYKAGKTGDPDHPGGGGGGFYHNGMDGINGKGGKSFLHGGRGGEKGGGFGGGGGRSHGFNVKRGSGGGGGYSGGSGGRNEDDSCGGGGGSFNDGKDQQNECCYNTAGHGHVIITLL